MMCLEVEPGAAGWKAQMNPLSYGGTQRIMLSHTFPFFKKRGTESEFKPSEPIHIISISCRE